MIGVLVLMIFKFGFVFGSGNIFFFTYICIYVGLLLFHFRIYFNSIWSLLLFYIFILTSFKFLVGFNRHCYRSIIIYTKIFYL
jgi:hypothetical protein